MVHSKDIKNGMQVYCKDANLVGTVESVEADGKSFKLKADTTGAAHWIALDTVQTCDAKGLHLKTNAADAKKAMHKAAPHAGHPA